MKKGLHTLSLRRIFTFFKKLRLYEILVIVFILILLSLWGIKEVTESPVFCGNSCHVMRPAYEEWKKSEHNNVPCIDCHIPPIEDPQFYPDFRALGRVFSYLTRTYGRYTRAEVEDSSCLREGCHTHRLLEGRVTYAADITFNHTPHLQQLRRGKILRCTTCHARNVMGEHITVVHDTCFICHLKGDRETLVTARCILCHQTEQLSAKETDGFNHSAYIQRSVPCVSCHDAVTTGNGQLDEESCNQCHGPSGPEMPHLPTEKLHRTHVTDHKVECGICHLPIRHGKKDDTVRSSLECGSCHENRHSGITTMYRGTGASGLPQDPSPMFLAGVDCVGCHRLPESGTSGDSQFVGETLTAGKAVCNQCHGRDMSGYLEEWTASVNAALAKAERVLEQAENAVAANGAKVLPGESSILDEARHNISFIRASLPIHNVDYAVSVLDRTAADLNSLLNEKRQR